ncbi:MAG: TetR/AcrR family transcriptional regulator [Tetrasphaera sp.]
MPKVTEERRVAVRTRILEAALRVFLDKGLAATSMADIIAESGMSAGAIYGHFTNKAELTSQVAKIVVAGRIDLIEERLGHEPLPPPDVLLRDLFDTIPDELLDSGLVLQIWGEAGPSGELRQLAAEAFATMGAAYGRYLTSWLVGQGHSTRAARTQARKLTPAFIGVAQGYLVHRAVLGRDAAAAYLDSIDHLVRGCMWQARS